MSNHINGHCTAISQMSTRLSLPWDPSPHFMPSNRYVSKHFALWANTEERQTYGRDNLAPVSELEAMVRESFPRISRFPPKFLPRTPYKLPSCQMCVRVSTLYVYACVLSTLFTPAWLPETALCPQSYRLRAVWHVIERHYVYHRPRTGCSTSYSLTLVLRKLQRKHNRDRRLMM